MEEHGVERARWSSIISRSMHRMPLVPAVALVMIGIALAEWTEPASVWWLAVPAITSFTAAVAALALQRPNLAMGCGGLGLLWAGATCHHLHRGPELDELGRRATYDYQPLVFRAAIAGPAVWRPNSQFRPGDDPGLRWRSQWKVRVYAVRDGRQWQSLSSHSTLSVAGRVDHLLPGDRVTVYGSCAAVAPPSNPGEDDLRKLFRGEKQFVFLRAESADQIVLESQTWNRPLARCVALAVRRIDRAIHRYVPLGQAPLAAALVFGQRQQVDWDAQQQLLSTGTLHMLAISGMHIELVAGALWLACLVVALRRRASLVVVAVIVASYALIAGANPPVLRAVFIVLAMCVARWQGRRRGLANLLAFSGLAILALRTSWIENVGVQLSFLAVATIAVFAQGRSGGRGERADALAAVIEESWSWKERTAMFVARWIWQMAALSFWVWLMTAPLIWMNFHVVSLVAIPLNILLWPFLVIGLLSGLALAVTWWLPPLAWVLGCICGGSLWMIGGIVWLGDALPLGHLWLPAPPLWWMVGFYAIAAVGVTAIQFRPRWRAWLGLALCGWLAMGVMPWLAGTRGHGPAWLRNMARAVESSGASAESELRATFIDVGHGTSVMLELPDGQVWLYDAGHLGTAERSHQEIAGALWSLPTARIDRLFISHADADHYNAIPGLVERFSIGQVEAPLQFWQHLAPELGELRQVVQRHRIPAMRLAQGDRFESGDVTAEVLHPPAQWSDTVDNGNSLTLLIRYAGRTCLLPGDLERAGLERLLAQSPRRCDVLMAPHHGSLAHDPRTVFAWCRPEWIVISGGPRAVRPDVVARYTLPGARTAITHRDGAVQMRIARDGTLSMWHWVENGWQEF